MNDASPSREASRASVGVVVCTRDRVDDLVRCLEGVCGQSVLPEKVVIVSGSPGSCPEGLKDRFAVLSMEIVACYEHNISVSRNAGMACCDTELVLFIDDDAVARIGWIDSYISAFARSPAAWSIGGDVLDSRDVPMRVEFSSGRIASDGRQQPIRNGDQSTEPKRYVSTVKGCNFGVRRQEILGLGGFDPFFAFGFDESDLMMRIHRAGGAVLHDPGAIVEHAHTPGHYREDGAMERDWRVEFASHTMFMLKHSSGGYSGVVRGWFVIWRRFAKHCLIAMTNAGLLRMRLSKSVSVVGKAWRGIGDGRRAFRNGS